MTTQTQLEHEIGCDSYGPGHQLHWTLWKAAANAPCLPVTRIREHGGGVELEVPGHPPLQWCHHDPIRLRTALEHAQGPIVACPRYRVLRVDGFWFNCAPLGSEFTLCG